MKMKHILFLGLVVAFVLTSCRQNTDVFIPDPLPEPPIPERMITTSISGIVVDELDMPIPDAEVKLNSETALTDESGVFIFNDIRVSENRAYLSISKSGYFHGSRALIAHENTNSTVKIKLLSREIVNTISVVEGGDATLPNGAKIKLPANGVVLANGDMYSGSQINIAAKYLNPEANDLGNIMPGDLLGINAEGNEQALATYGMLAVELVGDNGELLNLATDKTATLNFPIPMSLNSSAPSSIPLWYFDEEDGVWREEGEAIKEGNIYIGQVSHFSFWNCDVPYALSKIEGRVVDENNNPVAFTNVRINLGANVAWGMTDDEGRFSGKIPADELLTIDVNDECGNVVYTNEIGPFTSAENTLGDIVINNSNTVLITGTLVDCDNNPVNNGYIKVNSNTTGFNTFFTAEDGSFSYSFLPCSASISVQGIDMNNAKKTAVQDVSVDELVIGLGELQACLELDTYISLIIDGTTYAPQDAGASLDPNNGLTTIYSVASSAFFSLSFTGEGVGDYVAEASFASFTELYNSNAITEINIAINVSSYGDIGQYIGGTFSGTFKDIPTQTTHDISGSFRALRE